MKSETRNVLQAIRGNGLEVEVRRERSEVYVQVIDNRRQAESSFSFDGRSEDEVVGEIARRFCTIDQRVLIFGDEAQVVMDGPYRYEVA